MYYIATNKYGHVLNAGGKINLGDDIITEPVTLKLDAFSNEHVKRLLDPAHAEFAEILVDSTAEYAPLAAKRPTMIKTNGCATYRLFEVEACAGSDAHVLGDYLIADKIRVLREVTPACLFGNTNIYNDIMALHARLYIEAGERTFFDLCDNFEKYFFEEMRKEKFDHLDASIFQEESIVAVQFLQQMIFAEMKDVVDITRIMLNAQMITSHTMIPIIYTKIYNEMAIKNPAIRTDVMDELDNVTIDIMGEYFGDHL